MAPPRKPCAKCNKKIPAIALDCVFCGAKQAPPPLEELLPAALQKAKETAAKVEASGGDATEFADAFSTEPTLVGLKVSDLAALGIGAPQPSQGGGAADLPPIAPVDKKPEPVAKAAEPAPRPAEKPADKPQQKAPPPSTKITQATPALVEKPPEKAPDKRPAPAALAETIARVTKQSALLGGAVLLILFFMPWNGASSWQLLETLGGGAFLRQFHYLTGGLTLALAGLLPLPTRFRAAVILGVGVAPLLVFDDGSAWRGLVQLMVLAAGWGAMIRYAAGVPRHATLFGAIAGGLAAALLFSARSGATVMHLVGAIVCVAATGAAVAQLLLAWKSDAPSNTA